MTLSREFKEGMKYPQRIHSKATKCGIIRYDLSVRKAWHQVGKVIYASMIKESNECKGK